MTIATIEWNFRKLESIPFLSTTPKAITDRCDDNLCLALLSTTL